MFFLENPYFLGEKTHFFFGFLVFSLEFPCFCHFGGGTGCAALVALRRSGALPMATAGSVGLPSEGRIVFFFFFEESLDDLFFKTALPLFFSPQRSFKFFFFFLNFSMVFLWVSTVFHVFV